MGPEQLVAADFLAATADHSVMSLPPDIQHIS